MLFLVVMADAGENNSEDKDKDEDHEEDEPEGADDDVLLGGGNSVVEVNSLGNLENTEWREVVNVAVDVTDGLGEDEFLEIAGIVAGRKNSVASKGIFYVDSDKGIAMGVAAVLDGGGKVEIGIEREPRDGVLEDGAVASGNTANISINNTGESKDIIDVGIFGRPRIGVLGHDESGILPTSGDALRDVNGKGNILVLVGGEGACRVVDSDPLDDVGIGALLRKRIGIAESPERLSRHGKRKVLGSADGVRDGNATGVRLACLQRKPLTHRQHGKKFFFHIYYIITEM